MKAIAINAQLNPFVGGGVETNLQSLLGCKAIRATDLSIKLLAIERYTEAVRQISPSNAEAVPWPWGQDPITVRRTLFDGWVSRLPPPVRRQKVERWRVQTELKNERALRELAAKGDADLKRLGVGAVLANQYLAQLPESVRAAVLGTVRSQAVFQVEYDDARLLERRFAPSLTADDLMGMERYEIALRPSVNGQTALPVTGLTLPLGEPVRDAGD